MRKLKLISGCAIICLLIFYASVLLVSCGSAGVQPSVIKSSTEISEGQEATLTWAFDNADSVIVRGTGRKFNSVDSLVVAPKQSALFRIIAYKDEETSEIDWQVNVGKPIISSGTQKGAQIYHPEELAVSDNLSDYLSGIAPVSGSEQSCKIKVMRTFYPSEGGNSFKLQMLALDRNGNFLSGLGDNPDYKLNLFNECEDIADKVGMDRFREGAAGSARKNLDICVMFDNSAPAENNYSIIQNSEAAFSKFDKNYNLAVSFFNENYYPASPLTNMEKAVQLMKSAEIPWAYGLTGLYKALFNGIVDLYSKKTDNNKIVIAIIQGYDNASIIFQEHDIIDLSRKYGIPVYLIGVGKSIESYALKHLAAACGGRFYHILDESDINVGNIINEIVLSQNLNYEFEFSLNDNFRFCPEFYSTVIIESKSGKFSDKIYIPVEPEPVYSRYQSIASFKENESAYDNEFSENINKLGEILLQNPSFNIELIGHCSVGESHKEKKELGMRRAEAIKQVLISEGVPSHQILLRSDGANSPLYYFEEAPWQKYFNRRTEIRWLAPELLPYEIIADISPTETDAGEKVEHWKAQGFSAYYERYFVSSVPVYRVKLWGYKSFEEAAEVASKLEKKYKSGFKVE